MGKKSRKKSVRSAGDTLAFHRDMVVQEVLDMHAGARDVLLEFGLPCHRCVVAEHETLAEGCAPLALDVDEIIGRLNALARA